MEKVMKEILCKHPISLISLLGAACRSSHSWQKLMRNTGFKRDRKQHTGILLLNIPLHMGSQKVGRDWVTEHSTAVQWCELAISIHIPPPSWTSLPLCPPCHPCRSSYGTRLSSLCYTATFQLLSILHVVVYIFQCYSFYLFHPLERLLLNDKIQGFLASGRDEFNPGPETRLDRSELLYNKVLLKYKGDRESFWHRHQKGAERVPLLLVFSCMLYSHS